MGFPLFMSLLMNGNPRDPSGPSRTRGQAVGSVNAVVARSPTNPSAALPAPSVGPFGLRISPVRREGRRSGWRHTARADPAGSSLVEEILIDSLDPDRRPVRVSHTHTEIVPYHEAAELFAVDKHNALRALGRELLGGGSEVRGGNEHAILRVRSHQRADRVPQLGDVDRVAGCTLDPVEIRSLDLASSET